MALKRRAAFQHRQDPELNRALREVSRVINRQETSVVSGRYMVLRRGGGGAPGAAAGLRAYAGVAIDVYMYKATDPSNPDTLIGSTTTDATGYWELDLAAYWWANSIMEARQITYKRSEVVIGHKTTPEAIWVNVAGDGYLPLMVSNRELHT